MDSRLGCAAVTAAGLLAGVLGQRWARSDNAGQQHRGGRRRRKARDPFAQRDNAFFWAAFRSAMGAAGHAFPAGARASDVFDFRHNEDFRSTRDTGQVLRRGGEVYELPYGYQRFAVGVKGKYDSGNNTWLRNSGGSGEWAVAYHGTQHCNLPGILSGGFQVGPRQAYANEVGRGVYVTPHIRTAEMYTRVTNLSHNGEQKNVRIILQCRVRPSAIRKTTDSRGYWVINDPADVRPYGVLMKEG